MHPIYTFLITNALEISKCVKKHNVDFQRVPPHSHRRNAAERALQTWKNHFIVGLSYCDPKFLLSKWDHLLLQAKITLNLLRSSQHQPNLSAHACLFGNYDFNRCPLTPPRTKVIIMASTDPIIVPPVDATSHRHSSCSVFFLTIRSPFSSKFLFLRSLITSSCNPAATRRFHSLGL